MTLDAHQQEIATAILEDLRQRYTAPNDAHEKALWAWAAELAFDDLKTNDDRGRDIRHRAFHAILELITITAKHAHDEDLRRDGSPEEQTAWRNDGRARLKIEDRMHNRTRFWPPPGNGQRTSENQRDYARLNDDLTKIFGR